MFSVLRYSKRFLIREIVARQSNQFFILPNSERTHYFSSLTDSKDRSFIVSYLINTCGLSPESAESASKKVKIVNPQKANSVVELLSKYGFNTTQLSKLVQKYPFILSYNSKETLLPKLEFLESIGISDIGRVLSAQPYLLIISLENQMIPRYNFLKSVVRSHKKIVSIFERSSWVIPSKYTVPNITLLREFGVPSSGIESLLNNYPISIIQKSELFRVAVYKVKDMGFDPMKSSFVQAVRIFSGKGSKAIWDRCSEVYKKWGWSEDDILAAFMKAPRCMIISEKKIKREMEYFVDKFGYQSKEIAKFPTALFYSLEKRIVPRCLVIQVLSSKGLIKKLSLCTILLPSNKFFLERFVTRYADQIPELITVYRGDGDMATL